jgi:GNAT superfamily N-acetyltransferase
MEIRLLRESDDTAGFRCGDLDLDRFLERYARQNQFRHHVGSTYVAIEDTRVLGYVTLAPGHLERDDLPASERKSLPSYPLPVLRIARLATDLSVQGQGIGKELLRFALVLARRLATDYGCVGVLVEAKVDAVQFYERYGFVGLDVLEGQSHARPVPVAMFLSMRAIQAGSEKRKR